MEMAPVIQHMDVAVPLSEDVHQELSATTVEHSIPAKDNKENLGKHRMYAKVLTSKRLHTKA